VSIFLEYFKMLHQAAGMVEGFSSWQSVYKINAGQLNFAG